jgi:diguanylate cyclase (GGDEF)-like protein
MELAERIRSQLAAQDLAHEGNLPHGKVTLSVGLAFLRPDQETGMPQAYELADQALYRAKRNGRNTVSR